MTMLDHSQVVAAAKATADALRLSAVLAATEDTLAGNIAENVALSWERFALEVEAAATAPGVSEEVAAETRKHYRGTKQAVTTDRRGRLSLGPTHANALYYAETSPDGTITLTPTVAQSKVVDRGVARLGGRVRYEDIVGVIRAILPGDMRVLVSWLPDVRDDQTTPEEWLAEERLVRCDLSDRRLTFGEFPPAAFNDEERRLLAAPVSPKTIAAFS